MPTDISEDERAALLAAARAPIDARREKDRIESNNIAIQVVSISGYLARGRDLQVAIRAFQLASAMAEFTDIMYGEKERSFVRHVVPSEFSISSEAMAVMLAVMSFDTREDLLVEVYYEDIVDLLSLIRARQLYLCELESLNRLVDFDSLVQSVLNQLQHASVLNVSDESEWRERRVSYSQQSLERWYS